MGSGTASLTSATHTEHIFSAVWSPNGQHIAVSTFEGTITVIDPDGNLIRTLQETNNTPVVALDWHPDGTKLVSGGAAPLTIWDISTGTIEAELFGHSFAVYDVDWSPDGNKIASASFDSYPNGVIVWDVSTGEQLFSVADGLVTSVEWSPDGNLLAVGTLNAIELWDPTGELIRTLEVPDYQTALDWHPSGNQIAAAENYASGSGAVRIWDVATGNLVQALEEYAAAVVSVAWSPDGVRLASAARDGAIRIWDTDSGKNTIAFQEENPLLALDWSPDGSKIVYGGEEGITAIVESSLLITLPFADTFKSGSDKCLVDGDWDFVEDAATGNHLYTTTHSPNSGAYEDVLALSRPVDLSAYSDPAVHLRFQLRGTGIKASTCSTNAWSIDDIRLIA